VIVSSDGLLAAIDHAQHRRFAMKSECPSPLGFPERKDKATAPPESRFIDEKISDEYDTESTADNALAPAGLKNPFWN
jgi:hypothetical protein